jgi:hypothetical protein
MEYIIFVGEEKYVGPVPEETQQFLRESVLPALRPLSDEAYSLGPAYILRTLARFSYVLIDDALLWCIEWSPGGIVVRLAPDGTLAFCAFRSPDPDDEDEEDPFYALVFDAWDAQFDDELRDEGGFVPASESIKQKFEAATRHTNVLGDQISAGDNGWAETCKENLNRWLEA